MDNVSGSLVVFADDWGRHPSSCQHLMSRLLDRFSMTWVNTIGTRRPRLDLDSVRRGFEKIKHWFHRRVPTNGAPPTGPRVVNPRMWPWFGSALDRRLNHELLIRQLAPIVLTAPEPVVAVTTIPIVADLMGVLPVSRWVYYCVDDFGLWPGLDRRPLRRMEREVIRRADVLVAVSETLQRKLAQHGREAHLLTHGVDVDFWQDSTSNVAPEHLALSRPLIVFWGVIDRRMDLAFVERLANDLRDGTIVFVGPEADADPALKRLPRVVQLPALPLARLPALARQATVLIMPYADLPVTRAMQPLKLKEYLATGKPTVVRDLPSTRAWADAADLAVSPEAFARLVVTRLQTGLPESQRQARGRLANESWQAKARQFEKWIGAPQPSPHEHGAR
jgi:glycosyltransferase involved in cell wall biosynthesis